MKTVTLFAAAALALASITGCSSSESDAAPATQEGALANTQSLTGTFEHVEDRKKVRFAYEFKYTVGSAGEEVSWDAKVVEKNDHANVSDDKDEKGKVTATARCRGCFTAEIYAKNDGRVLAVVHVSADKVASIEYEGKQTKLITEPAGQGTTSAGSPDDLGACTVNGGQCKELKRSQCVSEAGFYTITRGVMVFKFEEGGDCT